MEKLIVIPFCPIDEKLRITADRNQTAWEIYPQYCRNSAIAILVVVGTIAFISFYLNCATLLSIWRSKFEAEDEKCTKVVMRKIEKHKKSIWRQKLFRSSLAVSGILPSVFLFPISAVIGAMMFDKEVVDSSQQLSQQIATYKSVANAVMHISILSTLYAMIGYVIERWLTLRNIQVDGYFIRVAKHDTVETPTQEKAKKMKPDFLQTFVLSVLGFIWGISITLSGLVGLPNSGIRFLLYGDYYSEEIAFPNGLLVVAENSANIVGIAYIILLFTPLIFLILALGFIVITLYQVQTRAKGSKYYHIALQATFPESKECQKFQRYVENVGNGQKSPNKTGENRAKNGGELDENKAKPQDQNAFSHKEEYLKQVQTDRHLNCIADIQTDSIQTGAENEPQVDLNLNKSTLKSRLGTYKFPKPPNWLKLSTMKRCNTGSRIQVTDLTKCGKTISKNCAKAFFAEVDETKVTIITCALICLFILPICGLIAVDMYSSSVLNTRNSDATLSSNISQDVESSTNRGPISKSIVLPNLGAIFTALFIFSGTLPYLVFINWSPLFQHGTSRVFRRKTETKPYKMTTPTKRGNLKLRGDPRKNDGTIQNSWHVFFRNSRDIAPWKPRVESSVHQQVVVNIDERFAMDATE